MAQGLSPLVSIKFAAQGEQRVVRAIEKSTQTHVDHLKRVASKPIRSEFIPPHRGRKINFSA
ncbi:MAG: hypothetical protein OEY85_01615 [Rhodospirillales bacterium]|nr:hypothetical protein [Rhodospirillales bacterium]